MIVVSDTTPLITLMKAGNLDILQSLFGEVILPEAVFSEVTENEIAHRRECWDFDKSISNWDTYSGRGGGCFGKDSKIKQTYQ